jgi:PAS domain S-box-containing protein
MASSAQPGSSNTLGRIARLWRRRAGTPARDTDVTHNIIDSSPMGMQFFTLHDDGHLVLSGANAAADRILGIQHAPLIGKTIEEAFPALTHTGVPAQYQRIAREGGVWRSQQIGVEAAQIRRAYEVHAFATGQGRLATIFFDITRRTRVEAEVSAWKQRYELVATASGEVVYDHDLKTGSLVWSGSLEKVFGYVPHDLSGGVQQWADCIHPEDRAETLRLREAAEQTAAPYDVEYRFRHKNGDYLWTHDRGSFLTDASQKPIRMIGMMNDITEHKRMEDSLRHAQKMEAIGQLAGGVAHDFNNILTAILGFNERMLARIPRDDPMYAHAIEIGKGAQRAAALTQQLLAFGRKQILQPRLLNLNDVIFDYEGMLARVIGENVEISIERGHNLHPVKADPDQIGQILMNLAINARDAMPSGGHLLIRTSNVTLNTEFICTHPDVTPGEYVLLAVSDTGHGLDTESKQRLFEPFFTTNESGNGAGLGLASTYGIVQQSSGHLFVESEPDQGTTFHVYLPVAEGAVTTSAPVPDDQLPHGTETILVAEDEPAVREFITLILRELGYTVLTAENGEEALHVARQFDGNRINLLFTDVVMPRMGGKELADALCAERPGLKVIFASGYTKDAFARNGSLPEGVILLSKPFTSAVLAKTVRRVLDSSGRELFDGKSAQPSLL